MQREESQLIEGLFDRLKTTEAQTAPRDREAEALIQQRLREQPAAPYYMAQAMLIQEAAIKRLDQRVKELESQMAQLQQNRPSSGGFLSSLFGGGQSSSAQAPAGNAAPSRGWNDPGPAAPRPGYGQPNPGYAQPAPGYGQPAPGYAAPQAQAAPSRMGGFMGGALQTAAGVAGGVLAAQAISGLFHHSQPEEIVNVINETPASDPGFAGGGAQDAWADNASYDNGGGFQDASNFQDNGGFQDAADYGDNGGGFLDDSGDDDSFI